MSAVRFAPSVRDKVGRSKSKDSVKITPEMPTHRYVPALYREMTAKLPESKVTELTSELLVDIKEAHRLREESVDSLKESFDKFREDISKYFKRNQYNIDVRRHNYVNQLANWKKTRQTDMDVLLVFKSTSYKCTPDSPGYVNFKLPKCNAKETDHNQKLRSADGTCISIKRCYEALHHIILNGISKQEELDGTDVQFDESAENPELTLKLLDGSTYNMVPCIIVSDDDPYYVAKPYISDEKTGSDIAWRMSYHDKENKILSTIGVSDKGRRLEAMMVLVEICKRDWRLDEIGSYHVKTVLMSEIDYEIDSSPRWQRLEIDNFLVALVTRLAQCLRDRKLEHFFMTSVNLVGGIGTRKMKFMADALFKMLNSDEDMCRAITNTQNRINAEKAGRTSHAVKYE